MPYHVAKSSKCPTSKPWACIMDSSGEVMGCHESEKDAEAQMAALYANEPASRSKRRRRRSRRSPATDPRTNLSRESAMSDAIRRAAEMRAEALDRNTEGGIRAARWQSTIGTGRQVEFPAQNLRAQMTERDGREFYQFRGYATMFEREYEMWDMFGPYGEIVSANASDETLAVGPDVAFLVNHRGLTMARTPGPWNGGNGTLFLSADLVGMPIEAFANPNREDVRTLASAVEDRLITEMSFAFAIPEDGGEWNADFTQFRIKKFDINRGDVSAVNYGANPFTSIAARSREIMHDLELLPEGAARAAIDRLQRRIGVVPMRPTSPVASPPEAQGASIDLYEAMLGIDL